MNVLPVQKVELFIAQPGGTLKKVTIFNVQWSVHRKCVPRYNIQDANFHSLFISVNCSTYFGCIPTHHQEQKTVSTASGTCETVTATCRYREELELRFHM